MNLKKYEYKIVEATRKGKWQSEIDVDANEDILIGLGLEGWELIQVSPHVQNNGLTAYLYYLKRELPPEDLV
ncbi:DUF4177 domain-containing protein [Flavilitoribacter nigricans]|uniref:DUF4177 domain-containing protein n=1 Tax=Flavilitoribacter nigricans (strain ATCC 23147 / DSM 23189 / NBRC 102662 / NCIMB 1420 / SS-2) TaxID=1122177 RepID=A0A2D0N4G0_FLAN2|nr:DUF4177 domain-containing protein [Flavilitoribacter nigricans]PHN03327.1 hypothetical protein CRP01_26960 [Flavilitoribacter nigricans DSM 23189 = NBRC 102662]